MPTASWSEVVRADGVLDAVARSGLVHRIEHHAEVGSTQDVAFDGGARPGTLVMADRQRAGRGRHGRSWRDGPHPLASLAASLVMPDRPAALGLVPLAVGLAVRDAVRDAVTDEATAGTLALRWPNDLLIGAAPARKCAGVLVERRALAPAERGVAPSVLVVGVGIDIDWRDAPSAGRAGSGERDWTSLAEASGAPVDPVALLAGLIDALERWLDADAARVLASHRAASASLGRDVVVTAADGSRLGGRALDLMPDGALVLEIDGERRVVDSGTLAGEPLGGERLDGERGTGTPVPTGEAARG